MTSPKALLKVWDLEAKKQLGQNFLSEPSTAAMIVERSGLVPDDIVLEIGSGLGALTVPAARTARQVYGVETDGRLIDILKTELLFHNLTNAEIMKQDILRFDFRAFAQEKALDRKLVVLGNLPYNISSQVIVRLIEHRDLVDRAVIMLQKELADRLVSRPGTRDYGRLTAMLNYCADIKNVARVEAHMFYPKPKVDSQVISITFRETPEHPARDEKFLYKVIKAAFGQRRKNLRNALIGSELHIQGEIALRGLENSGIDPTRRAETLSVKEFVDLSHSLSDLGISENPPDA